MGVHSVPPNPFPTRSTQRCTIPEHINEFNKIVLDLANIEVKFEDEDLALLLLTFISPASYEHFVDTLLYGREALTLEDVMATLNSKEIKERSKAKGDDGEGLYVRGRTDRRDSRQSRGKSRSKSRAPMSSTYEDFGGDDGAERTCSAQIGHGLSWVNNRGCKIMRYWQGKDTTERWSSFVYNTMSEEWFNPQSSNTEAIWKDSKRGKQLEEK
ncbi:hypothetical protein Tco_0814281 [Tanacetum coccineum]